MVDGRREVLKLMEHNGAKWIWAVVVGYLMGVGREVIDLLAP